MSLPQRVTLVEVGPRDGLQNESNTIDLSIKIQLISDLADAGLNVIEAGSFVNPKWVPQMADSDAVISGLQKKAGVRHAALTPNLKGFERALAAGADEVSMFAAASEDFSQKNINCSVNESLERFVPVISAASDAGLPVRGYVSCVLGCPYEGEVAREKVREVSTALLDMGCYEVALGDTIGTGTVGSMSRLLDCILADIPASQIAVHCHDTYGQALANILVALQHGITIIDSSVSGLGGCPYASGASGNVATEDVVYMLHGMGIDSGVDLKKLVIVGARVSRLLGRQSNSNAGRALLSENF